MRVLVAGAQGQLARALVEQAKKYPALLVIPLGRPQLDLASAEDTLRVVDAVRPQVVINAAAYTAVDKAESEHQTAFAINRDGARALASGARAVGCPIIHVSTDYVFDGTKWSPYVESDEANPIGTYGRSKLEGEIAVAEANAEHLILRTAWVFAPYGHNFLRTILRLAAERTELRVVADQVGNPTYAPHLADALLQLAMQIGDRRSCTWGTYHATCAGEASWHGFASAIVGASPHLRARQIPVVPITSAEYPMPVRRPANSRLDSSKLEQEFGLRLPSWQQGLEQCIAHLRDNQRP